MSIPQKKCGTLKPVHEIQLSVKEPIVHIFSGTSEGRKQAKSYLLVATICGKIFVYNSFNKQPLQEFDIYKFRVHQNSLNTIRLLSSKGPLDLRSNISPFIYHMQPYFEFDCNTNPVVLVLDREGVILVNLKSGEVNQL